MLSVVCLSSDMLLAMLVVICVILLIVELRISGFNVEANLVTFWFVDEHKVKWFVTLFALEFIERLVRLIPEKNLKLIRCYGLYSRACSHYRIAIKTKAN